MDRLRSPNQFGFRLFEKWEASDHNLVGLDDVRAVTANVYKSAADDFAASGMPVRSTNGSC
ncbi:MAG: hypothetical protein U0452_12055 [Anaerolineae bacterium]